MRNRRHDAVIQSRTMANRRLLARALQSKQNMALCTVPVVHGQCAVVIPAQLVQPCMRVRHAVADAHVGLDLVRCSIWFGFSDTGRPRQMLRACELHGHGCVVDVRERRRWWIWLPGAACLRSHHARSGAVAAARAGLVSARSRNVARFVGSNCAHAPSTS